MYTYLIKSLNWLPLGRLIVTSELPNPKPRDSVKDIVTYTNTVQFYGYGTGIPYYSTAVLERGCSK